MSSQIRGWHSSELLPVFIRNFVTSTWDHLQDIKAALSPLCHVNVLWCTVFVVWSVVVVATLALSEPVPQCEWVFSGHCQVSTDNNKWLWSMSQAVIIFLHLHMRHYFSTIMHCVHLQCYSPMVILGVLQAWQTHLMPFLCQITCGLLFFVGALIHFCVH